MLRQITSRQLSEWIAFARLEPFGYEARFFQAATIAAATMNAQRTKRSQHVFTPYDFIPDLEGKRKEARGSFFQNLKSFFALQKKDQ